MAMATVTKRAMVMAMRWRATKKGNGNSGKSDEVGNKEPLLPLRMPSIAAVDGRHHRCRTVNGERQWWSSSTVTAMARADAVGF